MTLGPATGETLLALARQAIATWLNVAERFEAVEESGRSGPSWYSSEAGLFSDEPHVVLQRSFWDEETRTETTRAARVRPATGE